MFTEPMLKIVLKYLSVQTHCKQYAFKKKWIWVVSPSYSTSLIAWRLFHPVRVTEHINSWNGVCYHCILYSVSVCALTLESDQLHTFLPWSMTTAWSETSEARIFYSLDELSFFDIDTVCFFSFLALHGLFIVLQYFGTMPKRGRCARSLAEIRDLLS